MTASLLSFYPLTGAFAAEIERRHGKVDEFVQVSSLKLLSPWPLLTRIRAIRGERLLLAFESSEAQALLPPLLILAFFSRCRQIEVIGPDLECIPQGRRQMIWQFATLAISEAWAVVLLVWYCLRASLVRPAAVHPRASNEVIYLDGNLAFGLEAGGSVGHTQGVIEALVRRRFKVDYISVKRSPSKLPEVRWRPAPKPQTLAYPAELAHYLFQAGFDRLASREIDRRKPAFIYQRMSLHNFSGAILSRRHQVPLIVEYNGSEVWAASNWSTPLQLRFAGRLTERAILRAAHLVVTVSEPLAENLRASGVSEADIVVYPNCIDPALFNPERFSVAERASLRERLNLRPEDQVVMFIGTFGTWHGVDFLARAVRRLISEDLEFVRRHRARFVFVGDGLRMPEVRAALGHSEYNEFVRLVGIVPQDQAPLYLSIANIFTSPHMPNPDGTPFFGSPTKLFEYMAMDRPIVAAALGQIADVLCPGSETGQDLAFLFEPGDEEGLLVSLRRALEDPDEGRRRASAARSEVLKRYTWDAHVAAILSRASERGILSGDVASS